MKPTSCAALLFLCLLGVRPAAAQESAEAVTYDLTLQQALELARTRSPSVLAAQARVAEAEGRLTEAELWHNNPTFELGGGPRIGPDDTTVDVDIGIGQEFELGGGRDARRDEAAADIDRAVALAEDASRRALGQVASAFLSVRYAQEHLAITVESERLATELLRAAQLRHEAGDVGVLDVNLATLSLARLQADIRTAEAARIRAEGALKLLLGLEPEASLVTSGDLLNRQRYQVDELLELASNRSDLEAIDAVERQADASLRLAEAQGWPDLGIHLGYGHEEDSNILVGAFRSPCPSSTMARVRKRSPEPKQIPPIPSARQSNARFFPRCALPMRRTRGFSMLWFNSSVTAFRLSKRATPSLTAATKRVPCNSVRYSRYGGNSSMRVSPI